jgi:hypothetical protein
MLVAFAVRTGLAGAYLIALTLNGRFDIGFAVLAVAVAMIWAAPLVRTAIRRHRHKLPAGAPVTPAAQAVRIFPQV